MGDRHLITREPSIYTPLAKVSFPGQDKGIKVLAFILKNRLQIFGVCNVVLLLAFIGLLIGLP